LLYPGGKYHRTVGKFFSYATGFNFSVENNSAAFEFIFGKRLSPKLSVGIGFAFSSHSLNNVQNANNFNNPNNVNDLSLLTGFTPLFAYSRYYFTDKKMRFFASANLGYSLGVLFASNKNGRNYIAIGQTFQQTNGMQLVRDALGNDIQFDFQFLFNRTVLKFGVEF